MMDLYCPDCGSKTLRLIEITPAGLDEHKECRTCDVCENMVYIHRNEPMSNGDTTYPESTTMDWDE